MSIILAVAVAAADVPALSDQEKQFIEAACSSPVVNGATMEHLGSIPTDAWVVSQQALPAQPSTMRLDGYSRIRIDFRPCAVQRPRDYSSESRWWRGLWGKHLQKTFQLSLKLSPTNVNVTPNLLVIKRDSDKNGESWLTSNDDGNIPTPYFRVVDGMKVALTPELISTRDYSSEIGSGLIDLVSRASAAIAPPVPLITSENKQRFNDAASFVDSTINGLLHVAIDEKTSIEIPLNPGSTGQVLGIYAVKLPFANDVYESSKRPDQVVGVWAVIAEPLRSSMFGQMNGDHLTEASLSTAGILNYQVDANKTVRETLAGDQNVVAARDELVKAAAKDVEGKAYKLCRLISDQAENLEMTPVDGAAIGWAFIKDLSLTDKGEKVALKGCSRIGNFPR